MTPEQLAAIQANPDYQQLVRQRTWLNWSLTTAMLVIYYGFVLLIAFSPETLGRSLSGGVTSVGMPVGVVVILLSFALTGVYVYRANRAIDPLNDKVCREVHP